MNIIQVINNKKIIVILLLLIGILVTLNIVIKGRPNISRVEPEKTSGLSLTPTFTFYFDKKPENITVETSPKFEFSQALEEKVIIVKPKEKLKPETKYRITLNYKNKPIYIYSFITRQVEKTEYFDKKQEKIKEDHPLIEYMPLENQYYQLTYSGPMQLKVYLKQATKQEALARIRQWMKDKGQDPESHEIVFGE